MLRSPEPDLHFFHCERTFILNLPGETTQFPVALLINYPIVDDDDPLKSVQQTVEQVGRKCLLIIDHRHFIGSSKVVWYEGRAALQCQKVALIGTQNINRIEIQAAALQKTHDL